MQIAFRCYDMDGDEQIEFSEISIILKNIPSKLENRYGSSFTKEKDSSRTEIMRKQEEDNKQIDTLMNVLEKNYEEGMYFDEFVKVAHEDTSELFVSIFNCIYECVPCVKNFFLMRSQYVKFLQSGGCLEKGIVFKPYTYTVLMPPVTDKMKFYISEYEEKKKTVGSK